MTHCDSLASISDDEPVRADCVSDVSDVATGFQVADPQHRLVASGFDLRDLPREAGRHIRRRLPRSGMVERAHDEDRPLHAA